MNVLDAAIDVRFDALRIDVSLRAGRGEVLGIVGANGAGKSSILRAIAGLRPLDGGEISIDGEIVDSPSSGVFVEPPIRRVGLVFQDHRLFPHLSALDNVAFGLRAMRRRTDARRIAAEWLDRFGLADHARHRPAVLSGGQAQRVALARTLATEPRVLLLDEPLAAIDATARPQLRADLQTHLAHFDGTTIVVSHDREDLIALASRVVVIDQGRVQLEAHPTELTHGLV